PITHKCGSGPTTSSAMFGSWRAAALSLTITTSLRLRPSLTSPQPLASASRPGSRTPTETRSHASSPSSCCRPPTRLARSASCRGDSVGYVVVNREGGLGRRSRQAPVDPRLHLRHQHVVAETL